MTIISGSNNTISRWLILTDIQIYKCSQFQYTTTAAGMIPPATRRTLDHLCVGRYLIQCPLFGVSVKRDSTVLGNGTRFLVSKHCEDEASFVVDQIWLERGRTHNKVHMLRLLQIVHNRHFQSDTILTFNIKEII